MALSKHEYSLSDTATFRVAVDVPCDTKPCLCLTSRTWRPRENYLVQFTGVQLGDPELLKIWEAYELGGNGQMDREELSFLMEDLCEVMHHIDSRGRDGVPALVVMVTTVVSEHEVIQHQPARKHEKQPHLRLNL